MKISLISVEIITEQISIVLIIPKSLRRIALTIANAPFTLCAERGAALTSFAILSWSEKSTFIVKFTLKTGGGKSYNREIPIFASKYSRKRTITQKHLLYETFYYLSPPLPALCLDERRTRKGTNVLLH